MDLYLLLAPVLLIPVVWLLRFVGCESFSAATEGDGTVAVKRINCGGGPVKADTAKGETLGWDADPATEGTAGAGKIGRDAVTDGTSAAGEVYETWRVGPGAPAVLQYVIALPEGDYKVTLKFAQLDDNPNIGGKFVVQIQKDPEFPIDAAPTIHPVSRKFDIAYPKDPKKKVHVDSTGTLTIAFKSTFGTFPFINAIEVKK